MPHYNRFSIFSVGCPRSSADALRASYHDPARVQTLPAGPLFDVVGVAMDLGLEALDLLMRSGAQLGPVGTRMVAVMAATFFVMMIARRT